MGSKTDYDTTSDGPVLYLESNELASSETFCTEVFDDVESEYRVVQLSSSRSFDSLRESLDIHLRKINDPSEAAVIITSPHSDDESTTTEVGDATPLYGFWVDPHDLTGISVAFSQLIERWQKTEGSVKICLRDIESLLPYHDTDLVYRFLNTVLATLQGAGADVHVHFRPSITDDQTLDLFKSLFSHVVEPDESTLQPAAESSADTETAPSTPSGSEEPADQSPTADADPRSSTMSNDEIETFLETEGYGILAFDGAPPYAIPMSYGYEADEQVFYLQLSDFEGSEKQARLSTSTAVSLVVTRYTRPDQWRSVVVDGSLSPLTQQEVRDRGGLEAFASSNLASVDVFSRDLADISFEWFVLDPTSISGRQSVS
jgi:hypothetical protein